MDRIPKQRYERIFSQWERIFSQWGGHRILIVGDVMLDEYLWGNVSRISPEAPVPVVEIASESVKLGGAANVALNVKTLGDEPILVGIAGEDGNRDKMISALNDVQISHEGILVDGSRMTTIKTRVIANHQQVVRADRESTEEISESMTGEILRLVEGKIKDIQGIIISDYGKGVITSALLSGLIGLSRAHGIFVAVDPKDTHFMNYQRVSLITPNHHEAGFVYGKRIRNDAILEEVGWGLLERLKATALLITRGDKGMSLFEEDRTLTHLPTRAKKVYDVTGAGDTVISAFTCAIAAKANYREAALISNHAAGLVVAELGTAQVTKAELMNDLEDFINSSQGGD